MASLYALGVLLALASAALFAVEYICIRLATDGGRISELMVVSLLTNVALVVPLVLAVHGLPTVTPVSLLAFVASGVFGSLLARLLVFKSVNRIGASRSSPVVATNVFFATVFATVLLGERLGPAHLVGIILIVAGVSVISWDLARESNPDAGLQDLGLSLALPLVAAFLVGVEPIFVSIGLAEGTSALSGFAIKAVTATTCFLAYLAWQGDSQTKFVRVDRYTKWYVGSGLASGFGIIAYFMALDAAPVVLVVPLFQTAPVFVVALSALLLPERLERVTARLVGSAVVVVVGTILVTVS